MYECINTTATELIPLFLIRWKSSRNLSKFTGCQTSNWKFKKKMTRFLQDLPIYGSKSLHSILVFNILPVHQSHLWRCYLTCWSDISPVSAPVSLPLQWFLHTGHQQSVFPVSSNNKKKTIFCILTYQKNG